LSWLSPGLSAWGWGLIVTIAPALFLLSSNLRLPWNNLLNDFWLLERDGHGEAYQSNVQYKLLPSAQ
jgi:hypothetical protein